MLWPARYIFNGGECDEECTLQPCTRYEEKTERLRNHNEDGGRRESKPKKVKSLKLVKESLDLFK